MHFQSISILEKQADYRLGCSVLSNKALSPSKEAYSGVNQRQFGARQDYSNSLELQKQTMADGVSARTLSRCLSHFDILINKTFYPGKTMPQNGNESKSIKQIKFTT